MIIVMTGLVAAAASRVAAVSIATFGHIAAKCGLAPTLERHAPSILEAAAIAVVAAALLISGVLEVLFISGVLGSLLLAGLITFLTKALIAAPRGAPLAFWAALFMGCCEIGCLTAAILLAAVVFLVAACISAKRSVFLGAISLVVNAARLYLAFMSTGIVLTASTSGASESAVLAFRVAPALAFLLTIAVTLHVNMPALDEKRKARNKASTPDRTRWPEKDIIRATRALLRFWFHHLTSDVEAELAVARVLLHAMRECVLLIKWLSGGRGVVEDDQTNHDWMKVFVHGRSMLYVEPSGDAAALKAQIESAHSLAKENQQLEYAGKQLPAAQVPAGFGGSEWEEEWDKEPHSPPEDETECVESGRAMASGEQCEREAIRVSMPCEAGWMQVVVARKAASTVAELKQDLERVYGIARGSFTLKSCGRLLVNADRVPRGAPIELWLAQKGGGGCLSRPRRREEREPAPISASPNPLPPHAAPLQQIPVTVPPPPTAHSPPGPPEEVSWKNMYAEVEGKYKAAEEKNRAVEEEKKALEEKIKALEEKNKSVEEKYKAVEENKAVEEKYKAVEENKAVEEKYKAVEETDKVVEETDKAVEEKYKAVKENKAAMQPKSKKAEGMLSKWRMLAWSDSQLHELFDEIDTNRSKDIDKPELTDYLKGQEGFGEWQQDEIEELWCFLRGKGKDSVSRKEFLEALMQPLQREELKLAMGAENLVDVLVSLLPLPEISDDGTIPHALSGVSELLNEDALTEHFRAKSRVLARETLEKLKPAFEAREKRSSEERKKNDDGSASKFVFEYANVREAEIGSIYRQLGLPSENIAAAMEQEHNSEEEWTTNNYGVTTTPKAEWEYVNSPKRMQEVYPGEGTVTHCGPLCPWMLSSQSVLCRYLSDCKRALCYRVLSGTAKTVAERRRRLEESEGRAAD